MDPPGVLAGEVWGQVMRLSNARLEDGRCVDVVVEGGRIAAFEPCGSGGGEDLAGRLLLPALVDGHVHLDKTLLGMGWRPNSGAADVRGRVENERAVRGGLALPVVVRAENLLRRMISHGTTALRTHVDIDDVVGLGNFHAVMQAVAPFRDLVDVQVVAFPQSGILTRPGVAGLLEEALREGADLVGGLDPLAIDGDVEGHLEVVFGLAERHGRGVDIHLHDVGPAGNAQLRAIAARAGRLGGRVTVSHAFSLGTADADDFAVTADALAASGVTILTSSPPSMVVPPVKALRARGVVVHGGSDNIRDLWSPFGNGDMLERAMLIALKQGFRSDADLALAYDVCAGEGAAALGLPGRAVAVGAAVDFIAVAAETRAEAVAERPGRRMVFKGARRLA